MAGSRVYVQEGIYDEFVKKAAEAAKSWVVGDPFDPTVQQGPQVILFSLKYKGVNMGKLCGTFLIRIMLVVYPDQCV